MDKVLTRKLFRDKYFQKHKPKTFNKGGLAGIQKFQTGGLSSKEKAILTLPFAQAFLLADQRPGETQRSSLARALGAGFAGVPASIEAIGKLRPKRNQLLTPAEVKAAGLTEGTVAQRDEKGKINVVQAPSAEEVKQTQAARRVQSIIGNIAQKYQQLGKPVGTVDFKRLGAFFGRAGGADYSKEYGKLKANIQQATSFISQAISGAAVSEQEAERIKKMIPQLSDSEVTFEAKLETLSGYFNQVEQIAKGNDTNILNAMNIMEQTGASDAFTDIDLAKQIVLERKGDTIDVSKN